MVNTKEYRGVSGIYKITCITNNKVYIGSAINISKRWSGHIHHLCMGTHHSSHLQNAWDKYGSEMFNFTVLEEVSDKTVLLSREQYWLDFYKSYSREYGFNVYSIAGSPQGVKRSKEYCEKISKSKKGLKQSPDHIAKRVAAHKGAKRSEKVKENISRAMYGKKQSLEHAAISSDAASKDWIITSPEGIQFEVHNLAKFCRDHGLSDGNMCRLAQGKIKYYRGWRCEYA